MKFLLPALLSALLASFMFIDGAASVPQQMTEEQRTSWNAFRSSDAYASARQAHSDHLNRNGAAQGALETANSDVDDRSAHIEAINRYEAAHPNAAGVADRIQAQHAARRAK